MKTLNELIEEELDKWFFTGMDDKQETIEEVAERLFSKEETRFVFNLGAKYQKARSYSEQDLREAFKSGRIVKNYKGEWQQTYSDNYTDAKYEDFDKWFEQFKKK